jgi:hypothetical protein
MNRISKCFRFRLNNMLKSTLWFTAIYFLVTCLLFTIGSSSATFSSGFIFSTAIFAFVYVISDYRASFNYLLINGNSRKTIYISNIAANIVFSAVLTGLSLISVIIEIYILKNITVHLEEGVSVFQMIYPNAAKAMEFPFLAAFFILLTSFSMLYGVLAYKFGKYFITIFWVGFGLLCITLPMSSNVTGLTILSVIRSYLWIDHPYGTLLASLDFIITAVLFSTAAYLLSRQQPQTAPVS